MQKVEIPQPTFKVEIELSVSEKKKIALVLSELFVSEFWNERALPVSLEMALLEIHKKVLEQ